MRYRRLVTTSVTVTMALCALLVTACGSSSKSSSQSTSPTSSSSASAGSGSGGASAVSAALKPYTVPPKQLPVTTPLPRKPPVENAVFLSNGVTIAQQLSAGLASASAALGWHYRTLTIDQNNPATIPSNMLSAINSGANVIFVSATPVAVFKSVLPVARKRHVAVVDLSSGNPPTPGITALITNASGNGRIWGKMLALGALQATPKAKIVLVTVPAFATILGDTDQGAKATVAKYCPSCSFATLNISLGDLASGKAPADVVSYLQSHQGTTTILQDSSLTDPGMVAALKTAQLSSIKIFGVVPTEPQVKEIASGQESGWVVNPLQVEGWMGIDAAARYFVGANAAIYDHRLGPYYLMTKSNVNGPTEFPTDYQTQFKHMWHVGP